MKTVQGATGTVQGALWKHCTVDLVNYLWIVMWRAYAEDTFCTETVLRTQEMSKSCSLWRDCAEDGGDYLRYAFCGLC